LNEIIFSTHGGLDYTCAYDEEADAYPEHLIDPEHPAYDRQAAVAQVRRDLWGNGFRPVPVHHHDLQWLPKKNRGKQPAGSGWQDLARANPPACVSQQPSVDSLNTGILCDGLYVVDIDIKGDCEFACNTDPLRADFASNSDPSVRCVSILPFGPGWSGRVLGRR
jgi:hypothetical protein